MGSLAGMDVGLSYYGSRFGKRNLCGCHNVTALQTHILARVPNN